MPRPNGRTADSGGALPLIGCLVPPPPWEGRPVGVSGKAVSILHPDGALVSVVGSAAAMEGRALAHPEGFRRFAKAAAEALEAVDEIEDLAAGPGAAEGAFVSWYGSKLELRALSPNRALSPDGFIADCASRGARGARLALDFAGAAIWDPRRSRRGPLSKGAAAAAVKAIERVIGAARAAGRARDGIHGDGPMGEAFRRLAERADFPACLVGFGPGTTPAGDDWVSGYMAARDLMVGGPGSAEAGLRARVAASLDRTTAAGRALLIGALAGVAPAYLVALVDAALAIGSDEGAIGVAEGTPADRDPKVGPAAGTPADRDPAIGAVEAAAAAALGHGATSGEDALMGFVAGLKTPRGGRTAPGDRSKDGAALYPRRGRDYTG